MHRRHIASPISIQHIHTADSFTILMDNIDPSTTTNDFTVVDDDALKRHNDIDDADGGGHEQLQLPGESSFAFYIRFMKTTPHLILLTSLYVIQGIPLGLVLACKSLLLIANKRFSFHSFHSSFTILVKETFELQSDWHFHIGLLSVQSQIVLVAFCR